MVNLAPSARPEADGHQTHRSLRLDARRNACHRADSVAARPGRRRNRPIPTAATQPFSECNFSGVESDGESDLDAIWRDALERLRGQMLTATYSRYLAGSRLVSLEDGVATVQPPDALAGERLAGPMRETIERAVGATMTLA